MGPRASIPHPDPSGELPARTWAALVWLAALVAACGFVPPIFEPDATLYATVARTIFETGDWVQLRVDGLDWLDKPHLPFWLAAAAFKLFGVSDVAYRLPSVAIGLGVGAVYTWRVAKRLHDVATARLAVLFLLTAYHLFVSNSDVRAEALLVGFVIAAWDHLDRADDDWRHAAIAGAWAGLAAMTKGPFVLAPICAGIVLVRLLGARRRFLWTRLPVFLLAFGVAIAPELACLAVQFDAHPEKVVFGRTGVSGLRFFFWDSQFGRFFNTGPYRGTGSPLFFLHTQLWAFLPWSGLLTAGTLRALWRSLPSTRTRGEGQGEGSGDDRHESGAAARLARPDQAPDDRSRAPAPSTSLGVIGRRALGLSAALTFLMFSASSFQLPHYLVTIFPFFAVLCAGWWREVSGRDGRAPAAWSALVWLGGAGAWGICALWVWASVDARPVGVALALLAGAALAARASRLQGGAVAFAAASSCALFAVTFLVRDTAFARYQSGYVAARHAAQRPAVPLVDPAGSRGLDFYRVSPRPPATLAELVSREPLWVYAERDDAATAALVAGHVVERVELPQFWVTRPTLQFLDADTREATLKHRVLLRTEPALQR